LPAIEAKLHGLARLRSEYPADDGVARLMVELIDGQMVESVLPPCGGLCVSTQVSCADGSISFASRSFLFAVISCSGHRYNPSFRRYRDLSCLIV